MYKLVTLYTRLPTECLIAQIAGILWLVNMFKLMCLYVTLVI